MRKLLAILLLPLLLVLIAAALAPKLAPEARLRAEAIEVMRAATGMDAAVEGDVRFSVLPWPSLQLEGLTVGEPDRAGLAVPQVRIVLDLFPLLTGAARADRIVLTDPVLTVPPAPSGDALVAPLLRQVAGKSVAADLRVTGGRVRLVDADGTVTTTAGLDGDLDWRGGSSLAFDGTLVWRDQPLDIDVAFSQLAALVQGKSARLKVAASGAAGTINYDGTFGFAGGLSAEGTLAMASRSVRSALEWLDLEAPTEGGFGPFALKADVLYSGQAAALSRARIELDGNVSDGGFNMRFDEGRAQIQGSLATSLLDLSPYGQIALAAPDGNDWSRDAIDLQKLRLIDLDLRLSAGELRAGTARLHRLAASATMRGGKLSLAIGEAEGWQGIFRASAQIAPAPAGRGADVRIELACDDVSLAQALGDIFRTQRLEGTGSFRMVANGSGATVADILGDLGGSFRLEGTDGALVGIDATRILARLAQRPLSGVGNLRGGRTTYDRIVAQATIAAGIATLGELSIDSARLAIRVSGATALATRDLDLAGTAELKEASDAPASFDLPFVVRGSWDQPLLLPDTQSLIRRSGAARPLFGNTETTGLPSTP